jgi:F420-0:gamma-glutamyl ligase
MRKRLKAIIELIPLASSVFALARETVAELEKLDPSPEQQAILAKLKGPLAQCKSEFKEAVKDVFGIMARIGR